MIQEDLKLKYRFKKDQTLPHATCGGTFSPFMQMCTEREVLRPELGWSRKWLFLLTRNS
jgi:hypothetical protein